MSKLLPRASNGFYQSLGNKTSPCSAGENEVISDCQGVDTKPCLFPRSFFYLQSKTFMPLEEETTDLHVQRHQAEILHSGKKQKQNQTNPGKGQESPRSISSVQFSHSVMSDSLRPHELQHARPPCPSPTPGVHPNLCTSSQWCHPTISSSVVPFSCVQSFPASGSFPMS